MCLICLFYNLCSFFHSCHCISLDFFGHYISLFHSLHVCYPHSTTGSFSFHHMHYLAPPGLLFFIPLQHFPLFFIAVCFSLIVLASVCLVLLSFSFLFLPLCSVSSSSLPSLLFLLSFHLLTCFRPHLLFPSWAFLWPTFPSPLRLRFLGGRWGTIL